MEPKDAGLDPNFTHLALSICEEIAGRNGLIAAFVYGSRASGYARSDSDYDILLVIQEYPSKVRYHYKDVQDVQLAVLAVDQGALEADVEKGVLGDFVAGRLLSPYIPLAGRDYVFDIEVKVKKRFALEEFEDLVLEYGELARGIIIKPEYLVLARMVKRSKVYSPLKYSYIQMLRPGLRERNLAQILRGYYEALEELQRERVIMYDGENIQLEGWYVDKVLSYRMLNRVVNLMDFSRRAFYAYITHGRAGRVTLEVVAKELASKLKRELQVSFNRKQIEDPANYLFLKTNTGLQSLNRTDVMVEKLRRLRGTDDVVARTLMSALNEVYLAEIGGDKYVVKRFSDFHNLKWFILNVAAYGTKIFSLQGKSRLANEYLTNRFLAENGIPVAEVVSVSIPDRILIERFIEGRSVLDFILEVMNIEHLNDEQKRLAFEIGKTIARVHDLEIVIGDCKPENFIIDNCGKVYVLDLEQGERRGDAAWDVAEFLYFSAHFATRFSGGFDEFIEAFIRGYLTLGSVQTLRKAGNVRYSKIFFAWAPVPVLQEISMRLQQVG
ncbi:MAG: lipopolysaccharide kinase InaA family protein [Candidatus Bathyarchaeia archaeon]